MLIRSYDFAEIEALQKFGDWTTAGSRLAADARRLQDAGAQIILLCTNTMHRVADVIEESVDVAFRHLADTTARAVERAGLARVALLGTRYTMERDFYRGRLQQRRGIEPIVPGDVDRGTVHDIIYQELVRGIVRDDSRMAYLDIISRLMADGAQGVIAGCTEIELLLTPDDVDGPYFPTTRLHALAAVDAALGEPATS